MRTHDNITIFFDFNVFSGAISISASSVRASSNRPDDIFKLYFITSRCRFYFHGGSILRRFDLLLIVFGAAAAVVFYHNFMRQIKYKHKIGRLVDGSFGTGCAAQTRKSRVFII